MTAILTRPEIDASLSLDDVRARSVSFDTISTEAIALLGFQRTKQISPASRDAWMSGDTKPLMTEAETRRTEIFEGAMLELLQEYVPTKAWLDTAPPQHVCDIGCGQALNDVLIQQDFAPRFTLIDVEETDEQYHGWATSGSGYASLDDAVALLKENGAKPAGLTAINPRKTALDIDAIDCDLVTSTYSCGFHYPIDEYEPLFLKTIQSGGRVCLDMRNHYFKRLSNRGSAFLDASEMTVVFEDAKSRRLGFAAK